MQAGTPEESTVLVEKVANLLDTMVLNQKTGQHVPRPTFSNMMAGFPCDDVSRENAEAKSNRQTIANGDLRTGSVFAELAQILEEDEQGEQKLEWGAWENVFAIQDPPKQESDEGERQPSNLDFIAAKMRGDCECFFKTFALQPNVIFKSDVRRLRCWMPWIKKRILGDTPDKEVHQIMQDRHAYHGSCLPACGRVNDI